MQISAANLLLAGQQAKPAQANKAAFETALHTKKPEAAEGFEALLFKPAAASKQAQAAPAAAGPAQPYTAPKPVGSQIDIRI
jgi:hypothetical protein